MEFNKTYYVYEHYRLDKNEVFYVGVGTKNSNVQSYNLYKRSKAKNGRGTIWKNIVNKTEYTIDIVFKSENLEETFKKEIELIAKYGKIKDKTGTLANITNGGEGNHGYKPTKEVIEAQRIKMLGRKASEETKKKMSVYQRSKSVSPEVGAKISKSKKGVKLKTKADNRKIKILHIPTQKVFKSMSSAASEFGYRSNFFRRYMKKNLLSDFRIISNEEFKNIIEKTGQIVPKKKVKPHTEEHKRNISKANKGKKMSKESKLKLSKAHLGKIVKESSKLKMSESNQNNTKVINILTKKVFRNITEAAKSENLHKMCLAKQLKTGYSLCKFEYCDIPNPPRKKIKVIKNKKSNQIVSIEDLIIIENMSETAINARLCRKSNTFGYYFDYVTIFELYKVNNNNENRIYI